MKKGKSSIGVKMVLILVVLGIITFLMCYLNLMAYDVLREYNQSLTEEIHGYKSMVENTAEMQNIASDIDFL